MSDSSASAQTLTEGLADLLMRPVGPNERTRARMHLVDWVGITSAAVGTEEGGILLTHAGKEPVGPATIVGGARTTQSAAMFANAGLGLILELDDVHREARLHPGPVVIPAALGLAEARGLTVGATLDAIVRGYEAMVRVGESVGNVHYERWHTTSSCGTFGAAAAAASLLELDRRALVDALGNAGTQSSGLWQCRPERTMSKPLHAARAACSGVDAAELALLGLTGPREILEGVQGFYVAICPDAVPEAVTGGEAEWRIHSCSIKPWPGCRHIHPAIDATEELELKPAHIDAIERIDVRTYGVALEFADLKHPRNPAEAKFSLQHAVAATLWRGGADLHLFDQAVIDDPGVRDLRDRIDVHSDGRFDTGYPAHWGAEVTVRLPSGSEVRNVADALGDPEHPMSMEQILAKARHLIASHGSLDVDRVIDVLLNSDEDLEVTELLEPLVVS